MKTAYSQGLTIDHTPSAQRLSGAGTLIGSVGNGMIGVAVNDVAASTEGVFAVQGVHTLPKLSTDVVAQGALLYWDNTNKRLTTTASGNTKVGVLTVAKLNTEAFATVRLNAVF